LPGIKRLRRDAEQIRALDWGQEQAASQSSRVASI
jgi:hypothetical protein